MITIQACIIQVVTVIKKIDSLNQVQILVTMSPTTYVSDKLIV